MCLPRLHRKARWKPDMKVKLFWVRKLRSTIERGDPLYAHTRQTTQNGMLIKLGLLKSGNLVKWWKIEQGDSLYSHSTRTDSLLDKMDSYTEAESEMLLGSRSFLHRVKDQVQKRKKAILKKMQRKTATNILWYGECACLLHCKHLYSWRRITQTKLHSIRKYRRSHKWNRCSTYLKNW